jgi:hypothetical protein
VRERLDGLCSLLLSVSCHTTLSVLLALMISGRFLYADVFYHLVEFGFHPGLEVGTDLVDVAELRERPTAEGAKMVYAGDPVRLYGRLLLLGVLSPIALDLDDQIERGCAIKISGMKSRRRPAGSPMTAQSCASIAGETRPG